VKAASAAWARRWAVAVAALLVTASSGARAAELSAGDAALDVHGFVSQGALLSTGNNYLARSEHGSFQFTEVGINFTSQLTDRLRLGVQMFAHNLGPVGNYELGADWFYLDYRWRDWLGLRAGRVKVPFGLYNETSDIDAARVAVLLPQGVYPLSNTNYLLAQTGLDLYGYVDLRGAGALDYRVYGGTIYVDTSTVPTLKDINVPYVTGARLMWETPVSGLRVGGSAQAIRLVFEFLPNPAAPTVPALNVGGTVLLGVASAEFVRGDLVLASEFSEWRTRLDTSYFAMLPPGNKQTTVSEHAYVLATYHVRPWLWPGAYYSVLFPDEATATFTGPSQNMQHDVAGTVRFDINSHWLVKLEAHYMHGTAGADSSLNDNRPLDALTRNWAVFLAKTTAYF
jgi:hypothetical protein